MSSVSNEYVGIFWLLTAVPQWAILFVTLLVGSGMGISFYLGDRVNGFHFNTSWSSMADLYFIVPVFIGITVLGRGDSLPTWFAGMTPQLVWLAISIGVGVMLLITKTPWTQAAWPERYHNIVVVPFYLFLVPLMGLVIAYRGNPFEKTGAIICFVIWAGCLAYDFSDDRINQRKWLTERYGIHFKDGRVVKPPNR